MRLMNPVSHVENHPRCRTNAEGEPLLPTDQPWRQQLAMFLVSSKLLIDTEEVLQVKQDAPASRAQCVSETPRRRWPRQPDHSRATISVGCTLHTLTSPGLEPLYACFLPGSDVHLAHGRRCACAVRSA